MCALFSWTAIYEPFLGVGGGSPVCALSRRSIGARNSSEHGALHVVPAHPLADCFCDRGKQADKDCFVYVARRRSDGSRLDVQAGGDRELAPYHRTLSGIRPGRKQMARYNFIRRLVGDGPANSIGLRGSVLLRPWWLARFCGECLHT